MNVKSRVLSAGVLFFLGGALMAQEAPKRDTLPNDDQKIGEVVVVGYQRKKTDEITQATSIVGAAEMKQQNPTTTLGNMLQGRASGVFSQTLSGQPGSLPTITVRQGSIIGSSEPLYVVNGMYMSAAQYSTINPSDVESQVILKDAASTSQYGSRGANGVIVVTTKSGRGSAPIYTFESRMGFTEYPGEKNFTFMNAKQKLDFENAYYQALTGAPRYSDANYNLLLSREHDWHNDLFQKGGQESYLFNVMGGTAASNYYYSLGYDHDGGIIRYLDGMKRYTGRFKFENKVSDYIKVGLSIGGAYQKLENQRDRNNSQNPINALYHYNPYELAYKADGTINTTFASGFPVIDGLLRNKSNNQDLRLDANLFTTIDLYKGLKFTSTINGVYGNLISNSIMEKGSYLDTTLGYGGSISKGTSTYFNYVFNNRLDWVRSFDKNNFNIAVFYEIGKSTTETFSGNGKTLKSPNLTVPSNVLTPLAFTGGRSSVFRNSAVGLLDYNYDKRFLISASVRYDGSSRFGANNQFGTFWSASAAWNIAKEDFFNNSIFTDLKLRASYGTRGNDINAADYANRNYLAYNDYGANPAAYINILGNPDLKWEKSGMYNLGAEFNIKRGRLRGSFEYYNEDRKDFIFLNSNYPAEGGSYSQYINAGNLRNRGIEVEISGDVIRTNDVTWTLRANYTKQNSLVKSLYNNLNEIPSGDTKLYVGKIPYTFFLIRSNGVDPTNGDQLYLDVNGNSTNVYSPSNSVLLDGKSPLPKGFGGFGTTLQIKSFDLSADFTYKYGAYAVNYQYFNNVDNSQFKTQLVTDALDYWTPEHPNAKYPKLSEDGIWLTDDFLQKTDYIRLRSVMIGYTFNKNVFGEKSIVKQIRVYATGQNLYLWTNYKGDPEVSIGSAESNTGPAGSTSLYTYPSTRNYLMGIQVTF